MKSISICCHPRFFRKIGVFLGIISAFISIFSVGNVYAENESTIIKTIETSPIAIAVNASGWVILGSNSDWCGWSYQVTLYPPNGYACSSSWHNISDIAIDSTGSIYFTDSVSNKVHKYSGVGIFYNNWATTGTNPKGITIDSAGNLYTANYGSNNITRMSPAGSSTTYGTTWSHPIDIAVDSAGNAYTVNIGSSNITKIAPNGTSTTYGTTGSNANSIVVDGSGNAYTTNNGSDNVSKITPDGTSTILGTTGSTPNGIVIDSEGNIYVANSGDDTVTRITPDGVSSIFWATGSYPIAIAIDSKGSIYTANKNSNNVTKITPDTAVPPVLTNFQYEVTIWEWTSYNPLSNISCFDNLDGDCTALITLSWSVDTGTQGDYTLYYSYTDTNGNLSNIESRIVHVWPPDSDPPYLEIYGDNPQAVMQNDTFYDNGSYCYDYYNGNYEYLTVTVSGGNIENNDGTIDTSILWSSVIIYSCTDNSGNSTSENRTVNVVPPPPPIDLSLTQTLTSTGVIHAGDTVRYEFKITNLSETDVDLPDTAIYAVIPDSVDLWASLLDGGSATYLVDKIDTSKIVCYNYEGFQNSNQEIEVAFGGYEHTNLTLCISQEIISIPVWGSFTFHVTTTALTDMTVWATSYSLLLSQTDPDYATLIEALGNGQSLFTLTTNNNAKSVYDPYASEDNWNGWNDSDEWTGWDNQNGSGGNESNENPTPSHPTVWPWSYSAGWGSSRESTILNSSTLVSDTGDHMSTFILSENATRLGKSIQNMLGNTDEITPSVSKTKNDAEKTPALKNTKKKSDTISLKQPTHREQFHSAHEDILIPSLFQSVFGKMFTILSDKK